jgi:hypothetical protein
MTHFDAVLPVVARDRERADLLVESLERHCPDLATCWIVAPGADLAALRHLEGGRYRLLDERELLPGRPGVLARRRLREPGWYLQQLLKLAIAECVATPHYLTLDADVVCLRTVTAQDLLPGGRAVVQVARDGVHADWYEWAERVLGLRRSGWRHGVTPAVLSVAAVRELAEHVGGRDWRRTLMDALPWTEYALYHTFLEATGRFDAHHVRVERDVLYGESVWDAEGFAAWDPARAFAGPDSPFFAVVQSRAGIDPARVRERLAPLLRA